MPAPLITIASTPELPKSADAVVIGGGIIGICTALELAERGLSVILLEARRIGWGASGRNGGQLIRGIGHDVSGFARYVGKEGVKYLEHAGIESVEVVRQRIAEHGIDCDLRWGFCDLANTPAQFAAFKDELVDLAELGYAHETRLIGPEQIRQQVVNSDIYAGGLVDMGSGHLHPLDLVQGEARLAASLGVRIFEQSEVLEIIHGDQPGVRTAQGRIDANQVLLAGDVYLSDAMYSRLSKRLMDPGSVAPSPMAGLTEREFEVLHLLGLGFGTRQIAEKLNRSVKTIESHRAALKEKLQLDSGNDLVRFAVQMAAQGRD